MKRVAALLAFGFLLTLPLTAQSVGSIVNIKDFLKTCPQNDPAINQIRADFQFYDQGTAVTTIACTEPYNQMDPTKITSDLAILQSLRVMYYMDQGRTNYLPWTSLRLYDWVKSKITGFNFVPGSSFACCTTINGKTVIFATVFDQVSLNAYRDFTGIAGGIAVVAHESRHVDGFPHTSCCPVGTGACDQTYDEKNLSPYGIQSWLYRNWLTGSINVGLYCSLSNEIRDANNNIGGGAKNYEQRFCDAKPPATPTYQVVADPPPFGSCSLRTLSLAGNGVTDAADYVNEIWPGMIMTLFGTGIGPAAPVNAPHVTKNTVDSVLGGTQVFFDGTPGAMIYTTANQMSAIAPFTLPGGANINGTTYSLVEVQTNAKLSNIVQVAKKNPIPGIFTSDGSGTGQAAALNQDGSVNSVSNPATIGSVVQFFATGFGNTTPAQTDGEVVPLTAPFPVISSGAGVFIGGVLAKVQYQGAAPGAVAGLTQVNAFVPAGIAVGPSVPVKMVFSGTSNTVTIAVQ